MKLLRYILLRLIVFAVFFILFYYYVPLRNTRPKTPEPNVTVLHKIDQLQEHPSERSSDVSYLPVVYIWCIVVKVEDKHSALLMKFKLFLKSLLYHSKCKLFLNILTDEKSRAFVDIVIVEGEDETGYKFYEIGFYAIKTAAKKIEYITQSMRTHFSSVPGTYYSDSLFYVSLGLHEIAPKYQHRVILLDVDLKFEESVAKLHQYFVKFGPKTLFALAPELTPVYRHILWKWKQAHQQSSYGEPSWKGYSGLNSGVMLLDLQRIRKSREYRECIIRPYVDSITQKYTFKGHLGDQDFYTLLAMEKPHMVYMLPCSWNRQLCQWWKYHGYAEVFDDFARCEGPVFIYHGNCNASIPIA